MKQTTPFSSVQLISFVLCMLFVATSCNVMGPSFKAEQVKPVATSPEINITDDRGNNFQLSALQGKVVLIFFGFTNCVDECPLIAARLRLTLDVLGDDAGKVQVVLISTDPVRDTPQAMQDFLGKFNPDFLGLPGDKEHLSSIWNDYGVVVLDGGETHSSSIYAIDKNGNLRLKIDAEALPDEIASDLRILLAE